MSAPRIVIGAGGTAGHVVPALAVADALRADGAEVHFIGGNRAEAKLVPEAGYEFHQLNVVSLPRRKPLAAARAVATDTRALGRCLSLIGQLAPSAVMGGGGYVAGPVGLAARIRRVPLVLTELDSHLGLTNKLLAPVARRVCLALPIPGTENAPPGRFLITGRPVPPLNTDRASARRRFGVADSETLVVVFGGSLGARSINFAALEAFAGAPFRVLHAAGERDLPLLEERGGAPGPHYDLRGYIDGFVDALVAADLVVARSGGSIFEIALAGKPSILVPYPHATADHQTTNARYLADAGAALIVPDQQLSAERLGSEVGQLLSDPKRMAAMGRAAAGLARPRAAEDIAAEVLAAAG
ncbi:MAG: UDP-N-acetylglucosamine--N-acetylmuramyl-(pentapeptide) pyrophosphoryl-undecaprenol N-acetylglucosamine transferase [Solirubrobacterales bacterium]|nr:UDP-N-acetylglucosamine--N-acetylmuramyl-(pentapeptide) pyrophosphoryl-undecaprenol N-acetylglucosamine transferase [Solirubrobacterales bacterium]